MAVPAGEKTELLTCPYNESHLILPKRFQVHLVRCRRSYPNAPVVVCPFNVTHRVNKAELEWHVSSCPSRQSFEHFRNRDDLNESNANSSVLKSNSNTANIKGGEYVESSECWDNEPEHPGYNPLEYVAKADVLRLPVGMTPSERKAFRLAERKRLQKLSK